MTLKPGTIASIQAMLESDPALLAQVQSCTDSAVAAEMITKAASAQGLHLGAPELATQVKAAPVAPQAALSDAELEKVAGGGYDCDGPNQSDRFCDNDED